MKYIDKLAWIHIQDNKILFTLSHERDTWYIPGGKREAGESDQQALIREIKEELSVDLVSDSLEFFGVFEAQAHGKDEDLLIKVVAYQGDYRGNLQASAEIAQFDFFTHAEVSGLVSPVSQIILDDLKARGLIK